MDDCNDNEPLAWTGADELCDGVDNDCDGGVDIGALNTRVWYFDNDNDGYGVSSPTTNSCDEPVGYADNMDDCNDNDNAIGGSQIWYPDSDNDSYGSDVSSIESCYSQFGHVLNMDDCDDTDDTVGPSQFWYLDDDEDGYGDPSTGVDSCEQPSGYTDNMNDCDDNDDGVGNLIWYYDGDNDGYGDPGSSQNVCAQPGNHVDNMDDCDDTEDFTHPGAAYNESPSECLTDQDGDGYSPSPDICFTLDMMDIYGDGWNGGHLIVTADGTQVPSGQPSFNPPYGGNTIPADAFYEAGDGADGNLLNNTLTTVSFCVETDTNLVLTYYPGSYEDENVYVLSDIQENEIFNDGPTPSSGAVFSEYVTGGGDGLDCNDYDQNTTQCPN